MFFHATLARSFIQSLRLRGDDDFVDRLNYYYTPIMLAVACLVISAKQVIWRDADRVLGESALLGESMEEYIESYCWIQNTYFIPMFENIPDDHTSREKQQIGYYQWTPFILIAEALMFSLPCILWRLLNWQTGLNIQNVVAAACDARSVVEPAEREKLLDSISSSVTPHPAASWFGRLKCTRLMNGHYVTFLYLFIKLCYTFNIMLQFIVLNAALKSDDYLLFGFQVLSDLAAGKPWTESGHFPRVTLCDFEVRYLANTNRYTVQCALLINIINEKVFAFFWVWYLVLAVITTCSTLFWISNCLLLSEKVDYVLKYMQIAESNDRKRRTKMLTVSQISGGGADGAVGGGVGHRDSEDCKELGFLPDTYLLHRFVTEFLKTDGIFTLRLMANHAGELVVMQVIRSLWREFAERNWRDIEEFASFRAHTLRHPSLHDRLPNSRHSNSNNHNGNGGSHRSRTLGIRMEQSMQVAGDLSIDHSRSFSPKSNHSIKSEPVIIASALAPKLTDSLSSGEKAVL
ncbi:Innexin [Aphelenchoides fujianensis]|nr:Innexin [Aphelenchoides fujianensis]